MIEQRTIDEVRAAASIAEVVEHCGVSLKKNTACCPFPDHNEKTPSFNVSPAKNIYKCFGCGKGGDPISFVMNYKGLDFNEAIHFLAEISGVQIRYCEEPDPEVKDKRERMLKLLGNVAKKYHQDLISASQSPDHPLFSFYKYLHDQRGLSEEIISLFGLGGNAEDGWKTITEGIIQKGFYSEGIELGIIKTKAENNFDVFVNRTIYPVRDARGQVVGFGGRVMDDSKPKYLNSSESEVFHKSHLLYGLHESLVQNKRMERAYLVEGYHDVLMCHQKELTTTVAGLGTAFTHQQARLLKRYTTQVSIWMDPDAAGIKAAIKAVQVLLSEGVIPFVVDSETQDPDEFLRGFEGTKQELIQQINTMQIDGIHYCANKLFSNLEDSPLAIGKAIEEVCSIIALIDNDATKELYLKQIAKEANGISVQTFKKVLNQVEKGREAVQVLNQDDKALPPGVDGDEYARYGFYELTEPKKCGYYFRSSESNATQQSNFIIRPFFHVQSIEDNKRILEIDNGQMRKTIEMPSASLTSLEQFKRVCYEQGNFIWWGSSAQLMRVLQKISEDFPFCLELRTLGWQSSGFFAWYNTMFNGVMKHFDEMGICDHEGTRYFSPAASKVYKDLQEDEDPFENDRYLKYYPKQVPFSQWAQMMWDVYGEKSMVGVGFALIGLFKNIIFSLDNNCPLLSCYGQKQSGKSKFAESITALYFNNLPPFNLNHGTDFAFANLLERYRNCVVWLDEFDDNAISEERFQAIKASYDGAGRQRGKGGSKRKTETQKINSALVLTGQYLSTHDDNSALSRCLLVEFESNPNRDDKTLQAYSTLKELEKRGLSGTLEDLLPLMQDFKRVYTTMFSEAFKSIRQYIQTSGDGYSERVLRNYCVLHAVLEFCDKNFTMPWKLSDVTAMIRKQVVKVSTLINESDSLSEFWKVLSYCADNGQVIEGWHYDHSTKMEVKIREGRGNERVVSFPQAKEIIFIRLNEIHTEYQKAHRQTTGKSGVNFQSLKLYLRGIPAWIGEVKNHRFSSPDGRDKVTSAYIFDAELLPVDLKGLQRQVKQNSSASLDEKVQQAKVSEQNGEDDELPF